MRPYLRGVPLPYRPSRVDLATALAAALAAAVWTLVAYHGSVLIALALPVVLAVLVLVALRPIWGVYLGCLAIPLERTSVHVGGTADITPSKALFLFAGVIAAGQLLFARQRIPVPRAFAPFAGLLLVMALGLTVAVDSTTTWKILVQWAAYLSLAVYLTGAERRQWQSIMLCLAVAGGIVGLMATLAGGSQQLIAGGQAATNRAQATFQAPTVMSFFLVLTVPLALVLAFKARPLLRAPMLLATGLAVSGILASLTRSSIIAVAVGLLVMLLWAPVRRACGALVLAAIVFMIFNASAIQRSPEVRVLGSRLSTIGQARATSDNERLLIWQKTPSIIAAHPFLGVGAGNFPAVSQQFGITGPDGLPFEHAHDIFLTIGAELGLLGLALFALFLVMVAAPAVHSVLHERAGPNFPYTLALSASLVGILACGIIDYPPGTLVIVGTIMVEVGVLFATLRPSAARRSGAG